MSYKLTYFNIAGRGEPARLIFVAAGVKFVDNRVKSEDWPALKASLDGGQLPVLQVGEKTLTQSKAIYRYLGRKFKLAGSDAWEAAKCDEVVDAVGDLLESYINFSFKEQNPVKKDEKKKAFLNEALPTYLGRMNKILEENGGGTWLVGKSMTFADLVVAEYLRQLCEGMADPFIIYKYPLVSKMQEAVFTNQNIKAYREAAK